MAPPLVAIVTGAAQGIGKAIALRLAQDDINVVVSDIPSKADKLEEVVAEIHSFKKQKALVITGDMSRESDVQKLVDDTVNEFGGLDVMVANAGIALVAPLVSTTVEDWDRVQAINSRGVFLAYKAAAVQMIKQGRGGRIIGASSVAGKQGFPEWGAYGSSKFLVRGLTQSAAAELKPYGITVNAYAPGLVNTPIFDDIHTHRSEQQLGELALNPDWKFLPADDVAGLVSYLVKKEAQFITGQSLSINGGMYFD